MLNINQFTYHYTLDHISEFEEQQPVEVYNKYRLEAIQQGLTPIYRNYFTFLVCCLGDYQVKHYQGCKRFISSRKEEEESC